MKAENLQISYKTGNVFEIDDLSIRDLIQRTIEFAANAYAPYSKFQVSAGVRLDNDEMIFGANMENASYPVCICAERNVLSTVVSNYPKAKIKSLVVFVDKELPSPASPCGLCRQTLAEVETRQQSPIELYMVAKDGRFIYLSKCADLLPWGFDGSYLSESK
jgi:cytidine deaminase